MNIKTIISISEARKKIFKIADSVQKPDTYYLLTEKGSPKAVVVSAEHFESLMETLETTKDFPNLEKDINRAKKEYKLKQTKSLEAILAERGFILSGKAR